MSQHDFNIANQGFPATRADINNAFQAIASNSSGPTAPSTTYANMWWYDTTNNKMYLRNEADSAWIEVATIDQTNNEWQITTGVVQAKDSDGLALKTDDGTTRLFIKDSNGAVGIGTASPNAPAAIVANTTTYEGLELVTPTGDGSGEFHIGVHDNGGSAGRSIVFRRGGSDGMDTESMRITSNGTLGLGVSDVDWGGSNIQMPYGSIFSGAFSVMGISSVSYDNGGWKYGASGQAPAKIELNAGNTIFSNAAAGTNDAALTWSERMRIDSSGNVLVGTTDHTPAEPGSSGNYGVSLRGGASSQISVNGTEAMWLNRDSSDGDIIRFRRSLSGVGSISVTTSSTSFNTSSDHRLKENITDVTDGITRVKQLAPKRFNFIADPDTTVDGFLAHEAQTVVPEAVTGTHDGMRDEEYEVTAALGEVYTPATDDADEVIHSTDVAEPETLADGQFWRETTAAVMGTRTVPDYQGIDQSKLVPLLTAALQEAIAKIEDLEARVAALESA